MGKPRQFKVWPTLKEHADDMFSANLGIEDRISTRAIFYTGALSVIYIISEEHLSSSGTPEGTAAKLSELQDEVTAWIEANKGRRE